MFAKGFIMRLFSKKPKTTDVIAVQTTEEPQKRVSYLDYFKRTGRANTLNRQEALNKLFPRRVGGFQAVKNGQRVAMDAVGIKPAMFADDLPDEMIPFFTHTFIGWQACALLFQNPFIQKACTIPAREAVAVDYKLHYKNAKADDDESTDAEAEQKILDDLKEKSDKVMKIKDVCREANICKKEYGQCILVPCFNTDVDMSKPFDPAKIKKNTYIGMKIIQPFWIRYELSPDAVSRPDKKDFYVPEYYIINEGIKIHKSWIVKLVNSEVSDMLKPVYYFGGIPLTQMIYERLFCAEKVANEAPKLALTKRLLTITENIQAIAANPDVYEENLQKLVEIRDNMGLLVVGQNGNVSQIDTSLTDFDALIMTQYQLVAAIAEMPVTKLMKTQLKGLSNTGDYETKDYNGTLAEIQKNDFNEILNRHYLLLCLSEHGRDLHIDPVWNLIDTPTETEMAQIESQQAQTDATYVSAGIVSPAEVRTMLRDNEDSRYRNLPVVPDDEDLGLLDDEEEQGEPTDKQVNAKDA